jgi:Domain of unknown function (DUF4386)
MTTIPTRLAAASGAFSALAVLIGAAIFDAEGTTLARTGYLLVVLGIVAFVVFVCFMHRVLLAADGPGGWAATLALGAGLLHSAARFEAQLPRMIESYRGDSLSPELARTVEDLNGMGFVISGLLMGLFVLTAAGVSVAHRVLPRWLGWFGVVTGVLAVVSGVVGMVDPNSYNPLAYVGGLVWVLAGSVVLTVRVPRAEESGRSAPPAVRADVAGAV